MASTPTDMDQIKSLSSSEQTQLLDVVDELRAEGWVTLLRCRNWS